MGCCGSCGGEEAKPTKDQEQGSTKEQEQKQEKSEA